jgi:hypothetical protein
MKIFISADHSENKEKLILNFVIYESQTVEFSQTESTTAGPGNRKQTSG